MCNASSRKEEAFCLDKEDDLSIEWIVSKVEGFSVVGNCGTDKNPVPTSTKLATGSILQFKNFLIECGCDEYFEEEGVLRIDSVQILACLIIATPGGVTSVLGLSQAA